MKLAPIPDKELERIAELMKYCILDTAPDDTFDQITKLAASICNTEIALVSFIDTNRQWFKSRFGLEATETLRDVSFCGHAIMSDEIFIVPNSDLDSRFSDNPLVTGDPLVKFYAGAPLITPSGHKIGTLCVIDHVEKAIRNINISLSTQNGLLLFSVKDNGAGVPEEIREKRFDPFFTTKELNMGTGIGLSLVSTIIKEHNGKIELESEMGVGSVFTILMPFDQNIQKTNNASIVPEGAQVDTKISRRILIVDDEEDLRDILTFILKKFCSNIFVSSNITEAYQSFIDNKIELVISDIKMPGGDGFKLLDKIRQNTTCAQPRFIFISGGNDITDEQSVLIKTQTDGLFSKPFQIKVITEKIKALFHEE